MKKTFLIMAFLLSCYFSNAQNIFPSSGNVGIGLENPAYKLEVHGSQALLRLVSNNSTPSYPSIDLYDNVHGTELIVSPSAQKVDIATYSHHPLALGTGAIERMRINEIGNVGIGTTNPFSKLHIRDGVNTGTISLGHDLYPALITSSAASGELRIDNRSSFVGYISFYPNGESHAIGSEAMRIVSSGNIGIGTSAPTEKLSVKGKIRAQEVKVEMNGWSDFVFAKNYQLPTLKEIENHIKEKGHLPGIPSAAEVMANGIDLGEMNAKLLQKIEELTLHLISKEKQVNGLQEEVSDLKQQVMQITKFINKKICNEK